MSKKDELHQVYLTMEELRWLWSTVSEVIEDRTRELVTSNIFRKNGTPKKSRKHYSVYMQSRVDDLEAAKDMKAFIESIRDFTPFDEEQPQCQTK